MQIENVIGINNYIIIVVGNEMVVQLESNGGDIVDGEL